MKNLFDVLQSLIPSQYAPVTALNKTINGCDIRLYVNETLDSVVVITIGGALGDGLAGSIEFLQKTEYAHRPYGLSRPLGSGPALITFDVNNKEVDKVFVGMIQPYARGTIKTMYAQNKALTDSGAWLEYPLETFQKQPIHHCLVGISEDTPITDVTGDVWPKTTKEAEALINSGAVKLDCKQILATHDAVFADTYYMLQIDNGYVVKLRVHHH